MRDRRLDGVEAVVERQQRVPAEGDDDRLLLGREHGRAGLPRPHTRIGGGLSPAPLLHGGWADAVALGGSPYALLTSLDCATDRLCRCGAAVENLAHSASRSAWLNVSPHNGTKHLSLDQQAVLSAAAEAEEVDRRHLVEA